MDDKTFIAAIVGAVFASGGFWALIQAVVAHFAAKKSNESRALLGLLHDRIYALCNQYIAQGRISTNEYKNLMALYEPYKALGGNSTAAHLMEVVDKLEQEVEGK